MPQHPPSARGGYETAEDDATHWQRRALAAERDLAELERRTEDRDATSAAMLRSIEEIIARRVPEEVAKVLSGRASPPPPPPPQLAVPTPSPYGYPPAVMQAPPAPYVAGLSPMRPQAFTDPNVQAYADNSKMWKHVRMVGAISGAIGLPALLMVGASVLAKHCEPPPPALPAPIVRATSAPH